MNYLRLHWRCPSALCPARINNQLLQHIRDEIKCLEPTWRHKWPPSLSTLKILTTDGVLPDTWEERFCKILQLPSTTWDDHLIPRTAAALISTRKKSLTTTAEKKLKMVTWNVNGLSSACTLQNDTKQRQVRSLTSNTTVVLTETKWEEGDHTRYMQQYGGTFICHTAAITSEMDGKSGGVAIIIPTHHWGKDIHTEIIMHGFAIKATVVNREHTTHITGVYAPPGKEWRILRQVQSCIGRIPINHTVLLLGDLNQAIKKLDEWQQFLAETLLCDSTPPNLPTFWSGGSKPASTLDRVLIRHTGIECGTHKCSIRASRLQLGKQEHAKVFACVAPLKYEKSPARRSFRPRHSLLVIALQRS